MERKTLGLALGLATLAVLAFPAATLASHARPKAASPLTVRLVPAFNACTTGANGFHGPPLALSSCNPPVERSSYLTLNASERPAPYNTPEAGTGSISLKVTCVLQVNPPVESGDTPPCNTNLGDQQDLKITFALEDVRCTGAPSQASCDGGVGSAGAGSPYSGKVLASSSLRITDHYNSLSPNPPGPDCSDTSTCTATVVDFPMDIGAQCINGTCNYTTSADAWIVGSIKEQTRAVVELNQVQVHDAGLNGNLVPAPPPTTGICPPACAQDDAGGVALVQGLFAP